MQKNALIPVLLVLASLLIAGCAATPTVHEARPIEGDLSRHSTVQAVVEASEHIRKQTGYDITAAELLKEFIANVSASGKYASAATGTPETKGLEARLTITDFNYVSGAARGLVGVLGGRAILHVTMTLKDNQTGAVVGTVSAGHASSHMQGVFSPVTSRQITAIAKELAAKLSERSKP